MVRSTDITAALRQTVAQVGKKYGLKPADISARSLRARGAMAIFLGRVDSNTIKLLRRWQSDEMMKYLDASAQQLTQQHAATMFRAVDYTLLAPPPILG